MQKRAPQHFVDSKRTRIHIAMLILHNFPINKIYKFWRKEKIDVNKARTYFLFLVYVIFLTGNHCKGSNWKCLFDLCWRAVMLDRLLLSRLWCGADSSPPVHFLNNSINNVSPRRDVLRKPQIVQFCDPNRTQPYSLTWFSQYIVPDFPMKIYRLKCVSHLQSRSAMQCFHSGELLDW